VDCPVFHVHQFARNVVRHRLQERQKKNKFLCKKCYFLAQIVQAISYIYDNASENYIKSIVNKLSSCIDAMEWVHLVPLEYTKTKTVVLRIPKYRFLKIKVVRFIKTNNLRKYKTIASNK